MSREPDEGEPLEPDAVTEGRTSPREARRERYLTREEYVTDEYTAGEATDALPAKRELGDADFRRGGLIAELASLPGIGPSTAADLVRIGIETVPDLARADPGRLVTDLVVEPPVAERWVQAARRWETESG